MLYAHSPTVRRSAHLDTREGCRRFARTTRMLLATQPDEAARVRRVAAELTSRIAHNKDLPPHGPDFAIHQLDPV